MGRSSRFDLSGFQRLGHLRPLALPGGEMAIREPWRLAAAALADAGEPLDLLERGPSALTPVRLRQLERLFASWAAFPQASAAGRWFDAAAVLCGVGLQVSYEGQAPCELEALAAPGRHGGYPFEIPASGDEPFVVDLRPVVCALAADRRAGEALPVIAARFHETMAQVVLAACQLARDEGAPALVALGGGCFANRLLAERALELLSQEDFEVLLPRRVPAGDGGLSLGQAAIASFALGRGDPPGAGEGTSHVSSHPG